MNREIKFKGKRIDNGEWVYGYYFSSSCGEHYILSNQTLPKPIGKYAPMLNTYFAKVIPESVGQQVIISGKKFYVGDKIKFTQKNPPLGQKPVSDIGVVEYNDRIGGYDIDRTLDVGNVGGSTLWSLFIDCDFEVVGNATENPELLEK